MSILRHWSSNVWLWVLLNTSLNLGPVIVKMAREGGVWMSILWHWTSDIWLRILFLIKLSKSPVVVEVAGES